MEDYGYNMLPTNDQQHDDGNHNNSTNDVDHTHLHIKDPKDFMDYLEKMTQINVIFSMLYSKFFQRLLLHIYFVITGVVLLEAMHYRVVHGTDKVDWNWLGIPVIFVLIVYALTDVISIAGILRAKTKNFSEKKITIDSKSLKSLQADNQKASLSNKESQKTVTSQHVTPWLLLCAALIAAITISYSLYYINQSSSRPIDDTVILVVLYVSFGVAMALLIGGDFRDHWWYKKNASFTTRQHYKAASNKNDVF